MRRSGDDSIGESLGRQNGLGEPSPEAHGPEGLYIAAAVVRDCQEVLVRVPNATRCDQRFTKECPLAHFEPLTLVTPPNVEKPHVQYATSKLQDMIAAAGPNLNDAESRVGGTVY
jgi:hypothetical protein